MKDRILVEKISKLQKSFNILQARVQELLFQNKYLQFDNECLKREKKELNKLVKELRNEE